MSPFEFFLSPEFWNWIFGAASVVLTFLKLKEARRARKASATKKR